MLTPRQSQLRASFFILIIILASVKFFPQQKPELISPLPVSGFNVEPVQAKEDHRTEKVRQLFLYYKSPLADYSPLFVELADKYGIDYRIAPVIMILESCGCRNLPVGIRFNCANIAVRIGWEYPSYEASIEALVSLIGGRNASSGFSKAQIRNASYYQPYRETITSNNPLGNLLLLGEIFEPTNPNYPINLKNMVEDF